MPAGLDGNPDPIRTAARDAVVRAVAERVCSPGEAAGRVAVGIDGGSGAGKSTFADELANALRGQGRLVIRSTTDSFHQPRATRMQRGPTSADGYFLDSHQLDRIVNELLVPFREGASEVLVAAFDEPTDAACPVVADVAPNAVLVFDGLFLHREELAGFWDVSVVLDADERRNAEWLRFLLDDLPASATHRAAELDRRLAIARWPRYRQGWSSYVDDVAPHDRATVVIDNNDLANPRILEISRSR
jgi:uridine kinase